MAAADRKAGRSTAFLITWRPTFPESSPPAMYATEGNTLTFEPILLKPGQGNEKTYEVVVTAKEEGGVRFRFEITAKELTAGPLVQETSTTISK